GEGRRMAVKGIDPYGLKTISSVLGDLWDDVRATKISSQVRRLASKETAIAREVFGSTIPYDRVLISDGKGFQGREYTTPVPYTSPRQYLIHVGDGYYGMSLFPGDQQTLIHELTHVWQGEHSKWAWTVVFDSGWHQLTKGQDA